MKLKRGCWRRGKGGIAMNARVAAACLLPSGGGVSGTRLRPLRHGLQQHELKPSHGRFLPCSLRISEQTLILSCYKTEFCSTDRSSLGFDLKKSR